MTASTGLSGANATASCSVTSKPCERSRALLSGFSSLTTALPGDASMSSIPLPAVGSNTRVFPSMPARREARKAMGTGVL